MSRHISSSSRLWVLPLVLILLLSCQLANESLQTMAEDEPAGAPAEAADVAAEADPAAGPDTDQPVPTPAAAPLPELSFAVQSTVPIPTQDEAVTAENGVVVQIGPESLPEGVEATLNQWDIDASWRAALEQAYTIETPFVSLSATGANDGQGRAALRLPAASPESQLVAVIDNTYMALLDVPQQDGYLEAAVRIGPTEAGTAEQVGSLAPGGSLQLAVLAPKTAAAGTSKDHFAKPAGQDGRSCGIDLDTSFGRLTHCRKSADGNVQVNFLWNIGFSDAEGDQLADAAAKAMARYLELGFTAAKLAPRWPMEIVVETRSGDPLYRSTSGVIYLPVDAAKGMISGATHDTLHEMAHWIEDEEYNMAWAYWSGGKTWWLETAAENMVMLHDPAYTPQNLITYGAITTDDNRLALQQSPYQWPGDFYAHAQLVKLNMCADTAVCALSESTFVEAINKGTYPYDNTGAQGKVSANLDNYAKYLLGVAPAGGNTAMPLGEPVASGDSYGEYIQIAKTSKTDYNLSFNGVAPQMQKGNDGRSDTVTVAATLQKDGVYPLNVSSGLNGRYPGLPVALTIQPGAPFWYRVGNDAPKFHDGSEELVLQPIHLDMGLPGVRLVALGKAGGETFRATVGQIDLQGAWLIVPGEKVSGQFTCIEEQSSRDVTTDLDDPGSLVMFPSLVTAMGDFRPDSTGNGLTWEWVMARVPPEGSGYIGSALTFSGAALPDVDRIQMQSEFELRKNAGQASIQPEWTPLLLGAAAIVPGALAARQGRKRPHLTMISLVLAMFLLAGCFGLGLDFWGTIASETQFTELEFLGGEAVPVISNYGLPSETPLWHMRGTADYTLDTNFAAYDEEEIASVVHCTGTETYNVEAKVFKDIVADLSE